MTRGGLLKDLGPATLIFFLIPMDDFFHSVRSVQKIQLFLIIIEKGGGVSKLGKRPPPVSDPEPVVLEGPFYLSPYTPKIQNTKEKKMEKNPHRAKIKYYPVLLERENCVK